MAAAAARVLPRDTWLSDPRANQWIFSSNTKFWFPKNRNIRPTTEYPRFWPETYQRPADAPTLPPLPPWIARPRAVATEVEASLDSAAVSDDSVAVSAAVVSEDSKEEKASENHCFFVQTQSGLADYKLERNESLLRMTTDAKDFDEFVAAVIQRVSEEFNEDTEHLLKTGFVGVRFKKSGAKAKTGAQKLLRTDFGSDEIDKYFYVASDVQNKLLVPRTAAVAKKRSRAESAETDESKKQSEIDDIINTIFLKLTRIWGMDYMEPDPFVEWCELIHKEKASYHKVPETLKDRVLKPKAVPPQAANPSTVPQSTDPMAAMQMQMQMSAQMQMTMNMSMQMQMRNEQSMRQHQAETQEMLRQTMGVMKDLATTVKQLKSEDK